MTAAGFVDLQGPTVEIQLLSVNKEEEGFVFVGRERKGKGRRVGPRTFGER